VTEHNPPPDAPAGSSSIDPFENSVIDTARGGTSYARFLELFRTVQDRVSSSGAPEHVWEGLAQQCEDVIAVLDEWVTPGIERIAGTRLDLPGRGNPLLLPFIREAESDNDIRGRVTFRPFHVGGNVAAHGGTLPLLFDEILGRLSNAGGRPMARTAYLTVNYRQVTPIGIELSLDATLDAIEDRKRWCSARLFNGPTLIAEAEGLFVRLLPGQP
jgi:hypothetical protein